MKKIFQLVLFLILLTPTLYAGQVQTLTLYFDKDKAVVNADGLQKLQALKAADMVILQGHTDSEGAQDYNVALSNRRVEAVKTAILQIDPGIKTETLSYGESKPLNNNVNETQKQLNRRVEISWISDPLLRIKTPVQFYEIDATKANTITCREGTKIEIPAGAFAAKKVLLKVSEYYNAASILSANLSTGSDGKAIESAGMLYVTAEANGQSIEPAQPLKFKFARNNTKQDFKLFEGVRSSNFEMNWKLNNTPTTSKAKVAETPASEIKKNASDTTNYVIQTSINYYTATVVGDVLGQLNSFWDNLQLKENRDRMTNGCLQGAVVDIAVNTDGRITSVTTSYTDKNSACDREVQKFVRACLPVRFQALQWNSHIQLYFDSTAQRYFGSTVTYATSSSWNGYAEYSKAEYETDKIVLNSAKLGWINCDRFLNVATINYGITTETDANVRLALKKYKSFFATIYRKNENNDPTSKFIFSNIPANEEAVIISTRSVNGKIMLAIENIKTSLSTPLPKLTYKEVTAAELEAAIKALKI